MAIVVTPGNKRDRDEVMGEHLIVVLSAVFHVDNKDLLYPESPLRQYVAFHEPVEFPIWPASPELLHVEKVG